MSAEILKFPCPACQATLTVPSAMAGVRGPCPICSAEIQAPSASPAAPTPPAQQPPNPAVPVLPPNETETGTVLPQEPIKLPPAPRHSQPVRSNKDIPARPIDPTDQASQGRVPVEKSATIPREKGSLLLKIGIPALLILASGAVVFLILKARNPEAGLPVSSSFELPEPGPAVSPPEAGSPPAGSDPKAASGPGENAPAPDAAVESSEPAPVSLNELNAAKRAAVSFLKSTSIESRLAMIEPPLPADQLKGTVLEGPLPAMIAIKDLPQVRDTIEEFIDFPFLVAFGDDAPIRRMLLIVRQRQSREPKVLVQPVLDLLGGRLKEFAKAPAEDTESREFCAVIEPMPRVFDEGVPNSDDKFTYKLLSADGGVEIARAYASQHSELAEQLYSFSPTSDMRWGKRLCATILLSWNTTEDPDKPYLWVNEIKSLNWSP